jgi:hypothetical protein
MGLSWRSIPRARRIRRAAGAPPDGLSLYASHGRRRLPPRKCCRRCCAFFLSAIVEDAINPFGVLEESFIGGVLLNVGCLALFRSVVTLFSLLYRPNSAPCRLLRLPDFLELADPLLLRFAGGTGGMWLDMFNKPRLRSWYNA